MASSAALAAFPEKPIKLVVGFRAGGGTDALATALSKEMEGVLGQPVVKEIRAGAGGGKAAASVKTAAPDGYTLVMAVTPTFAFNPAFAPTKTPYTKDDFDYIESLAKAQEGIYTKADAPFKSWKEMIAYAKKGNALNYAAVTPFDRLLTKYLSKKEGVTIKAVPTKGGSGAMKNVLGGHTELGFSGGNHIKHLGKGTITLLASLRSERLTNSPDVPTMIELGYPLSFEAHFLIAGPKGMPADVKKTLVDAIRKASKGPAVRQILKKLPFAEEQLGPDALTKLIGDAFKRYSDLVAANK
jgi:tripartite-type tricarboxylate transporter receptor subunit TctC